MTDSSYLWNTIDKTEPQVERTELAWQRRRRGDLPLVRDLMTSDPITLTESDSVKTMRDLMHWKGIRHLPVIDAQSQLVGLVTHRDFLTIAVSKLAHLPVKDTDELYEKLKVSEIMGRKVITTSPEALLSEASELMYRNKFGCLPVVQDGRVVGILTESDFVKAFMEWEARIHAAHLD